MIRPDIKYGVVPCSEISIDERELAARLGSGLGYSSDTLNSIISQFNDKVIYRYAYSVLPVKVLDNTCDFGFAKVESHDLSCILSSCQRAIFLAVTTGIETDRLIHRLERSSRSDAFFADSVGSAAIESFCNLICRRLANELPITKRFSPGYGDLPLEFQRDLLGRLDAHASVGITLNSSLLMTPMKSITAIIGINN